MSYIISQKEVVTRKEQRCIGCSRKFPSRTKMLRSCVKEDIVYTAYLCPTCRYIVDHELKVLEDFSEGNLYERAVEIEAERSNA